MGFHAVKLYRHGLIKSYITRTIGTSSCVSAAPKNNGGERHLPRNPNKSGPLTDLPDYTFLDGRITPLGANQTKRLLQQRELASKIVTMSREMDFAVERYNRLQEEKRQESRNIINQKLNPKGFSLLRK